MSDSQKGQGDIVHDLVSLAPQLDVDERLRQISGVPGVPEDVFCRAAAHEALGAERSWRRVGVVGIAALKTFGFIIRLVSCWRHTGGTLGVERVSL